MSLTELDNLVDRINQSINDNNGNDASPFTKLITDIKQEQNVLPIAIPSIRLDEISDLLSESVIPKTNGRFDAWLFLDFILKNANVADSSSSAALIDSLQPRIIALCTEYAYKQTPAQQFKPIAESLKLIFGPTIGALLTLKLKGAEKFAPAASSSNTNNNNNASATAQDAAVASSNNDGNINFNNNSNTNTSSNNALVVHKAVTSIGGFGVQTGANNRRDMGHIGALQVKSRDSMKAITQAAMYAPAAPSEIAMQHIPERDRRAKIGFMTQDMAEKAASSAKQHVSQRQEKLKNMFKKMREKEDGNGNENDRRPTRDADGNFLPPSGFDNNDGDDANENNNNNDAKKIAQALHGDDIVLPHEFPRDAFGVKIGYYPDGVRFIRDAIRDCGGAIELTVLEQRIGQLVNRDTRGNFGDLRQFLNIHRPTFTVVDEEDDEGKKLWIVRLTGDLDKIANDETGNSQTEPTWKLMICPHCTRKLRGRNFARHENCRKCVGVQIANGMRTGKFSEDHRSPILDLAASAHKVLSTPKDDLDEDDINFFGTCTEDAAKISRFRHSSEKAFAPIIKALRVLRDRFLQNHDAANFDAVKLTEDDGVYARFFRIWGENLLRLPIPWIETGDIIDIVHRFTNTVHRAALPPPRPGDPRIQVQNSYPGFLLAESGTDVDDMSDDPDDELSDDEAPAFHFAPPVTPMETVMAAGIERETKKLTYKLHTAPPVLAQQVITQTDGSGTLQNVHSMLKR